MARPATVPAARLAAGGAGLPERRIRARSIGPVDTSDDVGPVDAREASDQRGRQCERADAGTGAVLDDGTILKPVAVDTTVADGKGLMRTYRVRSGDTLTGIARKFGVSMMTVWWANNLTSKSELHVGQTLTIPPVSGVVVTVGPTDTLDTLAARYRVEAAEIVAANELEDPNLVIGQTLTIPGALGSGIATPKPAPTTTLKSPSSSSGGSGGSTKPPPKYNGGAFAWPVAGGYISQYYHYGHYAIDIAADSRHDRQGRRGGRRHLRRLEEQRRRLPGLDLARLRALHDLQPHVEHLASGVASTSAAASRSAGSGRPATRRARTSTSRSGRAPSGPAGHASTRSPTSEVAAGTSVRALAHALQSALAPVLPAAFA